MALEAVPVEDGKTDGLDILVHDETNRLIAQLLLDMPFGAFPVAMGVLYCNPAPTFEATVVEQRSEAAGRKRDLDALLSKGETWTVGPAGATGDSGSQVLPFGTRVRPFIGRVIFCRAHR